MDTYKCRACNMLDDLMKRIEKLESEMAEVLEPVTWPQEILDLAYPVDNDKKVT